MKNIMALTKRNCLLFFRSKATVLSSLCSSLILIALYFLFIANLYAQGMNELFAVSLSSKQINAMIYIQMIVGVLVINSVSLTTGMFCTMAADLERGKTESFLITKCKPIQLLLSYLFAAVIVSFVINILMFIIAVIIIGALTGYFISATAFFSAFGVLIITTFVSCAIMLLFTTIARSSTAIGVINGFAGSILGFLCGIYIPFSNLGKAAVYVGSFLPFTHLTIWFKRIVLKDVFVFANIPQETGEKIMEVGFSAGEVGLCGLNIPLWGMILFSCLFAVIAFVIAIFLLHRQLVSTKNKPLKFKKNQKKKTLT